MAIHTDMLARDGYSAARERAQYLYGYVESHCPPGFAEHQRHMEVPGNTPAIGNARGRTPSVGAAWSSPGRGYPYVNKEQRRTSHESRRMSNESQLEAMRELSQPYDSMPGPEWDMDRSRGGDMYGPDTRYDVVEGAVCGDGQRVPSGYDVGGSAASAYPLYHDLLGNSNPVQDPRLQTDARYWGANLPQPTTLDPYLEIALPHRQASRRQSPFVEPLVSQSPIKPPLQPSPEEALAQSGVHMSSWLAEAVWSMLVNPYEPGRPTDPLLRKVKQQYDENSLTTPPHTYLPSGARFGGNYNEGMRKMSSVDDLAFYSLDGGDMSPFSLLPARGAYVASGHVSPIHISPPASPRPYLLDNPYRLRHKVTSSFINFVYRTLSQTLLSPAGVILSLWYIRRFAIHSGGGEGGEQLRRMLYEAYLSEKGGEEVARRVVVLGLACSNKWLDDNTFTNKSWSDVTGLPLVELNRLEIVALSPRDINFDLSISHVEWQLWVEEVERLVSDPFVTDGHVVRSIIHTTLYPALEASQCRYAFEVETPRLLIEERDAEAERQRMEVERMLAAEAAEREEARLRHDQQLILMLKAYEVDKQAEQQRSQQLRTSRPSQGSYDTRHVNAMRPNTVDEWGTPYIAKGQMGVRSSAAVDSWDGAVASVAPARTTEDWTRRFHAWPQNDTPYTQSPRERYSFQDSYAPFNAESGRHVARYPTRGSYVPMPANDEPWRSQWRMRPAQVAA